jgi:hypothetical protein
LGTFDRFDTLPLECIESPSQYSYQTPIPSNPHTQGLVVDHQVVRKTQMGQDMETNQILPTDSSNTINDFADVSHAPAEELSEEQLRQIAGGLVGSDGGVSDAVDNNQDGRVDA